MTESVSQSMDHEAVYRTAPATLGLLITLRQDDWDCQAGRPNAIGSALLREE